jgi:hypothetical protein
LEKQDHLIQCQNKLIENSLVNEHHFEQRRQNGNQCEDDEMMEGGNLICNLCGEIVLKKLPGGVTNTSGQSMAGGLLGGLVNGLGPADSKGKSGKEYNRFGLLSKFGLLLIFIHKYVLTNNGGFFFRLQPRLLLLMYPTMAPKLYDQRQPNPPMLCCLRRRYSFRRSLVHLAIRRSRFERKHDSGVQGETFQSPL